VKRALPLAEAFDAVCFVAVLCAGLMMLGLGTAP
jgi:hypothetical protein